MCRLHKLYYVIHYKMKSMDFMLMLGLDETIGELAMTKCVCLFSHVLRREDYYVVRRVLMFEFDGQKKAKWKMTWKR